MRASCFVAWLPAGTLDGGAQAASRPANVNAGANAGGSLFAGYFT